MPQEHTMPKISYNSSDNSYRYRISIPVSAEMVQERQIDDEIEVRIRGKIKELESFEIEEPVDEIGGGSERQTRKMHNLGIKMSSAEVYETNEFSDLVEEE